MDPTKLAYLLAAVKILDEIIRLIPDKWLSAHTTIQMVTNMIKWLFGRLTGSSAAGAGLILLLSLPACASIGPVICGKGKVLVPPSFAACADAFLKAAASVVGDIAACRVEPTSAACIDGLLATGADLLECRPTCADAPVAGVGAGAPVKVSRAVVRTNVIESLRATGHPQAGK